MRLIYKEGGRSHNYYIKKGLNSIGRSPKQADLVLFDSSVSKKHVELSYNRKRKEVIIKDLGSSNGTLINGQRIREVVLADGDVIKIGQTKLLFTLDDEDYSEAEIDQIFGMGEEKMEAATLRPFLKIEDDDGVQTFPLGLENITIGHKSGNDIVVKGTGISRFHSEIYFDENAWWLKDLKSKNGTYVGGIKVEDDRELQAGDEIQVGNVFITFAFPREENLLDKFQKLELKMKIPILVGGVFMLSLFLYILLAPKPVPPPPKKKKSIVKLIERGLGFLIKEQYKEAERYFKEVRLKHNSEALDLFARTTPYLDFTTLNSKLFPKVEKALSLLKKLVKKEAPKNNEAVLKYLNGKLGLLRKEKENEARFDKATSMASTGELNKQEQAFRLFKQVDRSSKLYSEAKTAVIQLGESLRKKWWDRAKFRRNEINPLWDKAIYAYRQALRYGNRNTTFEIEVNSEIRICQKERKAQSNMEQGERYYQDGELTMALNYFRRVPESSLYYPKALERIQDIEKYNRRVDAKRLYEEAGGEEALKKLRPLSDPQASQLKNEIRKVVQAMSLGEKAMENDNYGEAIKYFKRIVKLVRNNRNAYKIQADNLLKRCRKKAKSGLRAAYNRGVESLENEAYGKALAAFKWVIENEVDKKTPYAKKVRSEIRIRSGELLNAAKNIKIQGRLSLYPKAKSICNLLKSFLPSDDSRRKEALRILSDLY